MPTACTATPRRPRFSPALLGLAGLSLVGCLVSDPATGPGAKKDSAIPEDDGKIAGSSSSTNWPPDVGDPRPITIFGEVTADVRIRFHRLSAEFPIEFQVARCAGTVRFYRSGVIPALTHQIPIEFAFPEAESVTISSRQLDSIASRLDQDTLRFNLNIQSDTLQVWLMGFTYIAAEKKFTSSPFSNSSIESGWLKPNTKFFKGNVLVDSLPASPLPGISEICFYIPGTPVFGKLKAGSQDSIGPLPEGKYPVRLLRISRASSQAKVTLVEAWEVHIAKQIENASFTPGAKVLSTEIQGELLLRE